MTSSSIHLTTFKSNMFCSVSNLVVFIIQICSNKNISDFTKILSFFGYSLYFTIIFSQRYVIEKADREVFLSDNKIKCELKKINDILTILVPDFIKDLFLRGYFFL